jgi:hypothetical protein
MKRTLIFPVFVVFACCLTAFAQPTPSLVGQWKGEDDGQVGIITFEKEGYVSFTINDEKVGGEDYTSEGIVFDMFYETDETVTPHTMDFVIKMDDDELEVARMLGIYHFTDDNTLIINMKFDGTPRPTMMDGESIDQITLTRLTDKKQKKKKKK